MGHAENASLPWPRLFPSSNKIRKSCRRIQLSLNHLSLASSPSRQPSQSYRSDQLNERWTNQVEKGGHRLSVRWTCPIYFLNLVLVVVETYPFSCECIGLFPTERCHPLCTRPHGACHVFNVNAMYRILAWSPAANSISRRERT